MGPSRGLARPLRLPARTETRELKLSTEDQFNLKEYKRTINKQAVRNATARVRPISNSIYAARPSIGQAQLDRHKSSNADFMILCDR